MVTFFVTITAFAFYLPHYGQTLSQDMVEKFYERSADAIAVFTGDRGRIEAAFELAKKMPTAELLITGVHNDNSLETIAKKQITHFSASEFLKKHSSLIDIDYEAKSTIENVFSTLIFSRQRKTIKNIIIVSSDYHLPRIQYILSQLKNDNDNVVFYYGAVKTTLSHPVNIKRYYKECFRFIKSMLFVTL